MDDPMTIIQRHHPEKFDDLLMLRATSEVSAVIGSATCMQSVGGDTIITWLAEDEDDSLSAQLSHHGVFVGDVVSKKKRYQIAGFCFLYGVPFFTEDDLIEMMEKELPADAETKLN